MIRYFFILVLVVVGCDTDDNNDDFDCATVLCAGRPNLTIDFIDAETGEQLLIAPDDIFPEGLTVFSNGNSSPLEAGQDYLVNDGVLLVYQIPDQTRIVLENSFDITVTAVIAESGINECCPIYVVDDITASEGSVEILDFKSNLRISL